MRDEPVTAPRDPAYSREAQTMNPITEGADHARGSEGTPIERTRKVGGGRESVAENRQAKAGAVAVPVAASMLRQWFARSRITHTALAAHVGCVKSMVSHLLAGRRSPSVHIAAAIELRTGIPASAWAVPLEVRG